MDYFTPNNVVAGFLALTIICMLGIATRCLLADGKADYCTITWEQSFSDSSYALNMHIPWRPDRGVGHFNTIDAAKEAAAKLSCEVY